MACVLVALGVDRWLHACHWPGSGRSARPEQLCSRLSTGSIEPACLAITDSGSFEAANASAHTACCGPTSIASNCAAQTQAARGDVLMLLHPALLPVLLSLFLVCNFYARRTFGWRFFNVSGYDLGARQQAPPRTLARLIHPQPRVSALFFVCCARAGPLTLVPACLGCRCCAITSSACTPRPTRSSA